MPARHAARNRVTWLGNMRLRSRHWQSAHNYKIAVRPAGVCDGLELFQLTARTCNPEHLSIMSRQPQLRLFRPATPVYLANSSTT